MPLHREIFPLNLMTVLMKQLRLVGSMEYPDDFGATIEILRAVDLGPVITHRFPLASFDEALAAARDKDSAGLVEKPAGELTNESLSPFARRLAFSRDGRFLAVARPDDVTALEKAANGNAVVRPVAMSTAIYNLPGLQQVAAIPTGKGNRIMAANAG